MKIKNNAIYHLPTKELEEKFLIQAEKQGIKWCSGDTATAKSYWDEHNGDYCISILNNRVSFGDLFFFQTESDYKEKSIVKWSPELEVEE